MVRYKELRELLASEIAAGNPAVGERFPTDLELCERFGVSRHTVREALRDLQDQGMLVRQRGSGTVVAAPPLKRVYSQTLQSLNELDTYAANVRLQIHSQGVVVLRPALAEILGADVGSKWLRIAGVRSLVGTVEPLAWTEIFIAEPYMGGRTRLNQGAEPFFEQLSREFGLVINEVEQRISAIAIPSDLAAHLQMTANEPALLVRRRYYADAVTPFEISVSVHPADRYASVTRVLRETPGRASQRDEGPTVS